MKTFALILAVAALSGCDLLSNDYAAGLALGEAAGRYEKCGIGARPRKAIGVSDTFVSGWREGYSTARCR
jgi:hypothetical protein